MAARDPFHEHEAFFQREFLQISIERYQISRIIYDRTNEVIVQWINSSYTVSQFNRY